MPRELAAFGGVAWASRPGFDVGLNVTTPLLTALAIVNAVLIASGAPRGMQLSVGAGLILLSALLFKDWIEGLIYLLLMP